MKKSQTTIEQPQVEILRKAVLLSITIHAWRNRAEADRDKITADCDSAKLSTSKKLIVSEKYDELVRYLEGAKRWCLKRSMMSGVRDGIFFVKRDVVPELEEHFAEVNRTVQSKYVPALLEDMPRAMGAARASAADGGLGALYRESDYPTAVQLPGLFSIEHAWTAMSVPNELPEEVRQRECAKLAKSFADAQEQVTYALRLGFKKIVDRACELLKPSADGKKRIFGKATLDTFDDFFDTFRARNIMDDSELAKLVADAKAATRGVKASGTKKMPDAVRADTARQFDAVAKRLEALVVDAPRRTFDLEAA